MGTRPVRSEEWRALRDLRLDALRDSPEAFGITYAESLTAPENEWQWWISGLGSDAAVVTFVEEGPSGFLGMATGAGDGDDPSLAHLFGMFVRITHRGTGLGTSLAAAVIDWARVSGFERLVLQVAEANTSARSLYERLGFEEVPDAARPLREGSELMTSTMEHLLADA